jgi:hypothetical protein
MDIFKYKNKKEAEFFVDNVILSCGRCLTETGSDGWYIRFELPFIVTTQYMDSNLFIMKTGHCRRVFVIRKSCKFPMYTISVWKPIQ